MFVVYFNYELILATDLWTKVRSSTLLCFTPSSLKLPGGEQLGASIIKTGEGYQQEGMLLGSLDLHLRTAAAWKQLGSRVAAATEQQKA